MFFEKIKKVLKMRSLETWGWGGADGHFGIIAKSYRKVCAGGTLIFVFLHNISEMNVPDTTQNEFQISNKSVE